MRDDDESISSDWESVRDDGAAKWETTRVVVELPSEGLDGVAAGGPTAMGEDSAAVAGANVGRLNDGLANNDTHSAAGSSISSFVPVSRFDEMSMQQKVAVTTSDGKALDEMKIGDNESTTGSSMSSFAHVSKFDDTSKRSEGALSSIPSSEVSSYQYKSEASSHAVVAFAAAADDDDSLLGNFEVLSLSSGQVVLRCKRCTFRNKTDAAVCGACHLALVANPNVDVDAQIAAHIAQAEGRVRDDPYFDHACILTNDLTRVCRPSSHRGTDAPVTRTLPECYLKPLAVDFIRAVVDFPDPKGIFLAFKCTSNSGRELECIQKRGLDPDQPFLNPTRVEVSHSLKNAMESFETLQMMRGELCTIREDAAESARVPDCLCWIVAVVAGASDTPEPSGLNTSWPPKQTLPVAYFDTSLDDYKHRGIWTLLCDLNRTISDEFFAENLNLNLVSEGNSALPGEDADDGNGPAITDAKRQKGAEDGHVSGRSEGNINPVASHRSFRYQRSLSRPRAETTDDSLRPTAASKDVSSPLRNLSPQEPITTQRIPRKGAIASHPPLDCPQFPPATVRKCIKTTVRVQNIVEPQEVLVLTSVNSSVESILSVNPDAMNHNSYAGGGGGGEGSLSESDFDSFDTDDEDDDEDDDGDSTNSDSTNSDDMDDGDGPNGQGPMKIEEGDDRPPLQDVNGTVNGSRNGSNKDVHDSATTAATDVSRNNSSNQDCQMKAFLKSQYPLCENHHGAYTTYIYNARVLLKADNNWIATDEEVAIKEVSWSAIRASRNRMSEDFVKEIAALHFISDWHNNVLDRRSIMDTHILSADTIMSNGSHLYIVMPYCSGGDLFQLVADKDQTRLTEDESRFWFRQILSALESLQLMQLCHKNLSPENFVILDDACLAIDFGMCLRIPYSHAGRHLITPRKACGKLPFVAPEILKQYPFDGHAIDIWAAGTILLFLLTGKRLPDPRLAEKLLQSKDLGVSYEALDLLRAMLRLDPNQRLSFDQVRNHNWVQQEYIDNNGMCGSKRP